MSWSTSLGTPDSGPDTVSELTGVKTVWTPKNHYIATDPGKMLRVIVAVGQRRGRLRNAYNALRGRDPRTGVVVPENRARELESLKRAQQHALNATNWDDFLRVMGRAGFRSRKMITSDNTVLYAYALWLIGLTEYKVDRDQPSRPDGTVVLHVQEPRAATPRTRRRRASRRISPVSMTCRPETQPVSPRSSTTSSARC